MRKTLILIAFLFIYQFSHAQLFTKEKITYDANQGRGTTDKNLLRWGYYLGFSSYDFNFDYNQDLKDIYVQRNAGFNVGLIGNLRINDFIDLRLEPGLLITTRNLFYSTEYFQGIESDPLHMKH